MQIQWEVGWNPKESLGQGGRSALPEFLLADCPAAHPPPPADGAPPHASQLAGQTSLTSEPTGTAALIPCRSVSQPNGTMAAHPMPKPASTPVGSSVQPPSEHATV